MKYSLLILTIALMSVLELRAQTTYLEVEPNHSTFGFSLDIAGGITKITGKFTEFNIYLDYIDKDLTKSAISIEIQSASISTGIPDRDGHLQSPDFFDVEAYPLITFESSEIRKDGDGFIAEGPFTMHGVTKTLQLPFRMTGEEGNTLGFALKTRINRIDFGVGAEFKHSAIENFLADEVDVEIYFWTKRDRKAKNETTRRQREQ